MDGRKSCSSSVHRASRICRRRTIKLFSLLAVALVCLLTSEHALAGHCEAGDENCAEQRSNADAYSRDANVATDGDAADAVKSTSSRHEDDDATGSDAESGDDEGIAEFDDNDDDDGDGGTDADAGYKEEGGEEDEESFAEVAEILQGRAQQEKDLPDVSFAARLKTAMASEKGGPAGSRISTKLQQAVDPEEDDVVLVCSCLPAESIGMVTALSADTGVMHWRVSLPGLIYSEPVHSADRRMVFVTTTAWSVIAIAVRDGTVQWEFSESSAAFMSSPLLGILSTLVVANVRASVYALNASDGRLLWSRDLGPGTMATSPVPAVASRDDVGVPVAVVTMANPGDGPATSTVLALDMHGGETVWTAPVNGTAMHSPAAILEETVVLGTLSASGESTVWALSAGRGSQLWAKTVCTNCSQSPGLLADSDSSHVLVVCSQGLLRGMEVESGNMGTLASIGKRLGMAVEVLARPSLRNDMVFIVATRSGLVVNFGISTARLHLVKVFYEPIVAAPVKGPYGNLFTVGFRGLVVSQEMSDVNPTWKTHVPGHIYTSIMYV